MTARRGATENGSSLVELLISLTVMSLAMSAAYSSLVTQIRSQATQAMISETLQAARLSFDVLADQITMAGWGVPEATTPSAAASIVTAQPTQLSFWANVSSVHTYLTANATMNSSSVQVLSSAGLAAGTSVYVTDGTRWYFGSVRSLSGTTLQLTPTLTYNFTAGARLTPVQQVTFDWADGALRRNGRVFVPNVTELSFAYDSPVPASIRVITISMTVQTRVADVASGARRSVTLGARVAPPNLTL